MTVPEWINVDELRTRISTATGEGVVVAILDTGIDTKHPGIPSEAILKSVQIECSGRSTEVRELDTASLTSAELDPVGHGTACAGIILQHAPAVKLLNVRVIGADATGTGDQFVAGMKWAISEAEPRPDIVNLSLGTMHRQFAAPLLDLVEQAYYQGTILVAAGPNIHGISFPSKFSSLIAVDNEAFDDPFEFQYHSSQPVEFSASGIYVRAPDSGGSYRLWTGTSFACPHVTAAVARLRSIDPSLTAFQIKTLLHALSTRQS